MSDEVSWQSGDTLRFGRVFRVDGKVISDDRGRIETPTRRELVLVIPSHGEPCFVAWGELKPRGEAA